MLDTLDKITDLFYIYIANGLLCLIGAIFISFYDTQTSHLKKIKIALSICWIAGFFYYLILGMAKFNNWNLIYPLINILNEISTAGIIYVVLLSFKCSPKKSFLIALIICIILLFIYIALKNSVVVSQWVAFVAFVLLGFIHRKVNINYALIFVAEGLAQIPIHILMDNNSMLGDVNNIFFISLLILKLPVISAQYSLLGHKK